MTSTLATAGALALAAGGLYLLFRLLRHDHDHPVVLLTLLLVVGGTPVLALTISRPFPWELALFAVTAAALLLARRLRTRPLLVTFVWSAVLLLPLATAWWTSAPLLSWAHGAFGSAAGRFSLTPVLYLASVATGVLLVRGRRDAAGGLAAVALWPPLTAPLLPLVVVLTPGLAATIAWARTRPLLALAPLLCGALLWNYWLMVQFTIGALPKDAPVSFATLVREQARMATLPPFTYPWAWPANAVLAWRAGVPVARWETLASEVPQTSFTLPLDERADRFLLDGWQRSSRGGARTVTGAATLLFPLHTDMASVRLVLTLVPGSAAGHGEGTRVLINGRDLGSLAAHTDAPDTLQLAIPASTVADLFREGYNRLSLVPPAATRLVIAQVRLAPA